jgi:hypothetical protein
MFWRPCSGPNLLLVRGATVSANRTAALIGMINGLQGPQLAAGAVQLRMILPGMLLSCVRPYEVVLGMLGLTSADA